LREADVVEVLLRELRQAASISLSLSRKLWGSQRSKLRDISRTVASPCRAISSSVRSTVSRTLASSWARSSADFAVLSQMAMGPSPADRRSN
jgi:hypothetical protein